MNDWLNMSTAVIRAVDATLQQQQQQQRTSSSDRKMHVTTR